ncbi:MAG: hypothetical protein LBT90_02095 [Holosporaceae bacterium]|nr:hypothetical protein [Holosporaceae bacterium]
MRILSTISRNSSTFTPVNTISHHRLAIACLAAAAIERVREAIWTIQNGIWYNFLKLSIFAPN